MSTSTVVIRSLSLSVSRSLFLAQLSLKVIVCTCIRTQRFVVHDKCVYVVFVLQLTDSGLQLLASRSPLKSLDISHCPQLTGTSLHHITQVYTCTCHIFHTSSHHRVHPPLYSPFHYKSLTSTPLSSLLP